MKLIQSQTQQINQQQLQNLELLQMSALELAAYIQTLAMENPLVELEDAGPAPEPAPDKELFSKLRWLEENDHQNRFYHQVAEDELDPLALAGNDGGLEETLYRFLSRQLQPLGLTDEQTQAVLYLAASLDDNGYLRAAPEELSSASGMPPALLRRGLEILQTLEPAGVGARDLSQCLCLQLERIGQTGPALAIVRDHLELLARGRYKTIADRLGISVSQVQQAAQFIRELDPRPGAVFQRPEQVAYILPDVFVERDETGRYTVTPRRGDRPPFRISNYYKKLLAQSGDREVREYLSGKLHQAENVLWAVNQRSETLLRCAQVIADRQSGFFRDGPTTLLPLRLSDVADALGVHESTVSRAVRGKYLQCERGVYPLHYFFSRPASGSGRSAAGGTAARALLRQIIAGEDKQAPLSDQKLAERMAEAGFPVSRRTVAKYRSELNLPDASARRLQASSI